MIPLASLKRLGREDGVALPIALSVLMISLALMGAAAAVAIDTNTAANADAGAKAAIEAADAGERTAIYRLNMYRPDSNSCPTVPTSSVQSGGLCAQDGPESLGNGASFSYWISRVLQTGDKCAGSTVLSSQANVAQRCVTAIGTQAMGAQNVSARVQERVAAYTSVPVFPAAIFGTKSVTINNNATITSNTQSVPALLGTNGVLNVAPSGGGTTTIDGYQLPPGAALNIGKNVTNVGPTTPLSIPYPTPTAIDPKTSAQNTVSTYQGGTCNVLPTQVQTNCDYRITNGIQHPGCVSGGLPVLECDTAAGGVTFNATTRTLSLGNNSQLTLTGGVYNFCSLTMSNNSTLFVAPAPGHSVSIYIDSPQDPNSGSAASAPAATNPKCATGTGTFTMSQNAVLNPSGTALNAQIYVYGDPNDTPPTNAVTLANNSNSSYAIAAPFSNVTLNPSNNSKFTGAIVGYTVTLGNASHFIYEADASTLQSGALDLYYRTFFEQCPALPTHSNDPTSGC